MKFGIQTINHQIVHEFAFTLIKAIEYKQFLGHECNYVLVDDGRPALECVPVGSVEFVCDYIEYHHGLCPKPKNIPVQLRAPEFTKRHVFIGTEKDVTPDVFFKSHDQIKGYSINAEVLDPVGQCPPGKYLISEQVEIESEWRTFIFKGNIVGLQNYLGDFTLFPDVDLIREMVAAFMPAPVAYTLDVGINSRGTFIIEVHDFFSCGLYGFADLNILPAMFSNWMYQFINQNTKVNHGQGKE